MGQFSFDVDASNFQQIVMEGSRRVPVVVDFWAEWCGPCKMIAPILDQLADELGDRVRIVKLNIDENPQTAVRYGVRSIPTLILFKNGEVAATKVGAAPKGKLVEWLEESL